MSRASVPVEPCRHRRAAALRNILVLAVVVAVLGAVAHSRGFGSPENRLYRAFMKVDGSMTYAQVDREIGKSRNASGVFGMESPDFQIEYVPGGRKKADSGMLWQFGGQDSEYLILFAPDGHVAYKAYRRKH